MINFIIGITFLTIVTITWTVLFGFVDTLPFGMETPVQIFSNAVATATSILPMISTPWELFITAIEIKMSIIVLFTTMWFMKLLRG